MNGLNQYPHFGLCCDCDSITDLNARMVCKKCQTRVFECQKMQAELLRQGKIIRARARRMKDLFFKKAPAFAEAPSLMN